MSPINSAEGLEAYFTLREVEAKLSKSRNTSGIRYSLLKKYDPGCLVLLVLFNQCKKFCRLLGSQWKKATTVLIHKKSVPDDLSSWKPTAPCFTMYKLYASCIIIRITDWAVKRRAISQTQKGFLSNKGCYKSNFILQMALE